MSRLVIRTLVVWSCLLPVIISAAENDAEQLAFFEKKIRPVLVKHCYECHSDKAAKSNKIKGGLRVDTKQALLAGGDSGPGVVPGKPGESALIAALKYESFEMPPKGKLPADVIRDFETWIEQGAIDPRLDVTPNATTKKSIDLEAGRQFWSYKPLQNVPVPAVKDAKWARGDIDRFVLAKLDGAKLAPASDADPVTLVRRVYFDAWGLPPTPAQIDAFLTDVSAHQGDLNHALEKLVDQLLASPHFGERWGRHWLDVARYAESLTLRGFVLKDAWRYRDYVIDAFNQDMPFDQFVREQLAGDLLVEADDSLDVKRRKLIATSFLALGNTNLEEQDKKTLVMDVVDEQLETVCKAFLAQTIGCARCHDHKFDPIPTRDYYALAGIFKNSKTLEHSNVSKWMEVALPMTAEQEAEIKKHTAQVSAMKQEIEQLKKLVKGDDKSAAAKANPKEKKDSKRGSIAIADLPGIVVDDTQAKKVGDWTSSAFSKPFVGEGYVHDGNKEKGAKTLTFDPDLPTTGKYEVRLAYSGDSGRASKVPVTVFSADGEKTILVDQSEEGPIDEIFVSLGQYRFEVGGQSFVLISNEDTSGHVTADAVVFIPVEKLAELEKAKKETPKADTPSIVPSTATVETAKPHPAQMQARMKQLEDDLKSLEKTGPKRDTVITVVEEAKIENARVHIRGSVQTLGDVVPRGFLQVATYGSPSLPDERHSGRRELADWLVQRDNPLTARVMVNRVWHWLFGSGLVRTTDNFGSTGEVPSHPELLDHLAQRFIADGWSVKRLVRELVLSRTYRQSSQATAEQLAADPENRLFAHTNRRRLEGECLRDAILLASGRLKTEGGGPSFDLALSADFGFTHQDSRRTVYSPAFRNARIELVEVFDAADPSTVTGKRNTSTVAPQALFLLNHPFVLDESKAASKRLLEIPNQSDSERLQSAYRHVLGRVPSSAEHEIALRFIRDRSADPQSAYAALFQTLWASIDFRFVK